MEYSKESLDRQAKIQMMKEAGIVCYANSFEGKIDIEEIISRSENDDKWGHIRDIENLMEGGCIWEFRTAGRIMSSRGMGKLVFGKLRDKSWDIQICFMRDRVVFNTGRPLPNSWVRTPPSLPLSREEEKDAPLDKGRLSEGLRGLVTELEIWWEMKSAFKIAEKFCQVGDYIGVEGDLFVTKHGELTIFVKEFQILSKAIRPLPEKFHGLSDRETIYRQRYLDLITNNDSYDRFRFRSDFVKAIRDFYHKHDFVEIETPVLWNAASGAAAQPFTTHHNDFWEDFFLRIAPETSLKKATVWRFERVFELSRNFRNEGSDPSHVQEFSAFEHYAAYWNFEDNMQFTEDMFDYIFETLGLEKKRRIIDKEWQEKQVDFSTPWQRIDYIAWVKEQSGIDIESYREEDEQRLREDIQKAWFSWEGIEKQATATMIDYLYKKVLRPWIVGPAFVYNYPKTMQPLARQSDADENIVEQFQLVLNGWEVLKAYSELVDPKIQQDNFEAQSWAIEKGDEEATSWDDDFVLAMEYGMPCQSGWGMGVERIVALLTGQDNLRDVQLFPLMKSDDNEEKYNKNDTKLAVAILNTDANLEKWQELNTVAHLNASFAAREGKSIFMQDSIESADGMQMKLNMSHAIMIKQASSNQICELRDKANELWLSLVEFTREMIETSDDKKVADITATKKWDELEFLWIQIFWTRKVVESLTKDLELYK